MSVLFPLFVLRMLFVSSLFTRLVMTEMTEMTKSDNYRNSIIKILGVSENILCLFYESDEDVRILD